MESTPTEEAEGQAIVRVLAVVLERLVSANSHLAESSQAPQEQTHFHAQRAPAIGILQYLERIHKYASCSKECFILALIYIDRLIQRNNFLLTELNVHRVVITAVLLAAKFFDDAYYNNAYYAKVGGVLVEEMNNLECQFLFKIDFSLRVLPEVFDKYSVELVSHSSAAGIDRITTCTDGELFHHHQHQGATPKVPIPQACHHQSVAQAPMQQQAYPQAEPVVFHDPAPVAPAPMEPHYPIQALQTSVTAPIAAPQVHASQQCQQQATNLDPVYPFPNLAAQVSANHQAQAPPAQNPSELNLVYHNAPAAPQDVYNPNQALHQGAPQAQAYAQPEHDPAYSNLNQAMANATMDESSHYPIQVNAGAPATQAPAYPQHQQQTGYFNNGAVQATRAMIQNHPEITPSPPPQPPMSHIHGAPMAYVNGEVGFPVNLTGSNYYPTPADAAMDLHRSQHMLPSRPIAIGGHHHHHASNRDVGGGWSCMLSLEGGTGTTPPQPA